MNGVQFQRSHLITVILEDTCHHTVGIHGPELRNSRMKICTLCQSSLADVERPNIVHPRLV